MTGKNPVKATDSQGLRAETATQFADVKPFLSALLTKVRWFHIFYPLGLLILLIEHSHVITATAVIMPLGFFFPFQSTVDFLANGIIFLPGVQLDWFWQQGNFYISIVIVLLKLLQQKTERNR